MTNVFDPKKPVQTRGGKPARIICTDRKSSGGYPIVAMWTADDGEEVIYGYRTDGRWLGPMENDSDLVNVSQVKWLCCFDDGPGRVYHDTEKAATDAGKRSAGFVCVVKVEFP